MLDVSDLKNIDEDVYANVMKLREAVDVDDWDLDFTITEMDDKGKPNQVELKEGGKDVLLSNQNKEEYIKLLIDYYLHSTNEQLEAIKTGLYQFIPVDYLQEFEPEEVEQIVSGSSKIDIEDLKQNSEYTDFTENTQTVKWFWEIVSSLTHEELSQLLHFITGSTKVPIGGFAHLYGSNGPQKFSIHQKKIVGLPTAHSCFNRLELCVYKSKEKLKQELLCAVKETKGFGME